MSEDNQENGASNGDVPEIELIIKDETKTIEVSQSEENSIPPKQLDQLRLPVMKVCSGSDQYIIYELKSDSQPAHKNPKEPPPDCSNPKEHTTSDSIISSSVTKVFVNPGPYTISFQIPIQPVKEIYPKSKRELVRKRSVLAKTKRILARERLAEAIDAVVNKDMTIGKAAKAFEVTKSTLWKEVNKQTDRRKKKVNENLTKKIVDRICGGESLSAISRSLNVAKSTIHEHKVRLGQAGKLPPNVTFKPPLDKTQQEAIKNRIIGAFRAVRVNGMSLRLASEYFSVPRSTLWKHIQRFKASQKKLEKDAPKECKDTEKTAEDESSSNEETSEEEEDSTEADDSPDEVANEDASEEMNESTSDVQSTTTTETDRQDDFDLLDLSSASQLGDPSEDGDIFIGFDFESFEDYVKTELEK